jgi:ArsR family transcriptional regulator, arsenate/arsenite/antimonite-responsive transcriptional repressor
MESATAVQRLAALAQDRRLAIFRLLVQCGPNGKPAGEIATSVGLAPATLSFHLKELSQAGLAISRQDGRFVHYSANYAAMNELLTYLSENCCAGESCADPAPPCCEPKAR